MTKALTDEEVFNFFYSDKKQEIKSMSEQVERRVHPVIQFFKDCFAWCKYDSCGCHKPDCQEHGVKEKPVDCCRPEQPKPVLKVKTPKVQRDSKGRFSKKVTKKQK